MCVISVALALVWKDGRLLISRRRSDQHLGGLWEFPGGKCEDGESPEMCAVREALEEVGVVCEAVSSRSPIAHAYPERTVRMIPVDCRYLDGEARPISVQEVRWALPTELSDFPFPAANRSLLIELCAGTGAPRREPDDDSGTLSE